jgi:hypothetical protein
MNSCRISRIHRKRDGSKAGSELRDQFSGINRAGGEFDVRVWIPITTRNQLSWCAHLNTGATMAINHELVPIALQHADGGEFENFANAFFSALLGVDFVPLGGMHDGGADAFLASVSADEEGRFLQATIRADHRTKIRQTLQALEKNGRTPKQLIYATSGLIPFLDREEEQLFEIHKIPIRIRDRNYFRFHINDNDGATAAFETYLQPLLRFLEGFGSASLISPTPDLPSKSLCVFLGQEIERRRGNTDLLESVTDSLILWALRNTDPDKKIFLTKADVLREILTVLPSAKQFVKGTLDARLVALSSKNSTNGRAVRWHTKENKYCLPYETRRIVANENAEDELLKSSVTDVFIRRLGEIATKIGKGFSFDDAVGVCFRTIELTFQKQGIEVSYFMSGEEPENTIQRTIVDHIDQAIEDLQIEPKEREAIKEGAFNVLRKAFYNSDEVERIYLNKLCRTFCLLFTLQSHPHIVDYFRGMSSRLTLYVGSDLVVRALSERFLRKEDAMTRNMFELLKRAGSKLLLTDRCLDELHTHIIACDQEYRNHYQRVNHLMTPQLARQISEILIRTYFYGAFEAQEKGKDVNWPSFLGQFLSYGDLYGERGRESLKRYLCEAFGFEFEPEQEARNSLDLVELDELKQAIVQARPWKTEKQDVLAENDAFHVLRVYSKRLELGEVHKPNPYGYGSWWLTQESAIRKATGKLVARKGCSYIMRPEFLLNYIALSPKMEEVRASYESVFPTLLGVQLSNRMDENVFKSFIKKVGETQNIDDARARALVSEYSDKLKSDQFKLYSHQLPPMEEMYKN